MQAYHTLWHFFTVAEYSDVASTDKCAAMCNMFYTSTFNGCSLFVFVAATKGCFVGRLDKYRRFDVDSVPEGVATVHVNPETAVTTIVDYYYVDQGSSSDWAKYIFRREDLSQLSNPMNGEKVCKTMVLKETSVVLAECAHLIVFAVLFLHGLRGQVLAVRVRRRLLQHGQPP